MILLTVGTEKFSFHRLVDTFDELCRGPLEDQDCFAQIGSSKTNPKSVPFEKLVPFQRMRELTESADLVITHAGAGSMLLALRSGKRPIVVPRLARHGEHVDDHQLQLARKLAAEDLIRCVEDIDQLESEILAARTSQASQEAVARPLQLTSKLEAIVRDVESGKGIGAFDPRPRD